MKERRKFRFSTKKPVESFSRNRPPRPDMDLGRIVTKMLPWGILLGIAYFLFEYFFSD